MSFAPPEHSSRVFETEGLIIGGPGSVVVVVGQSTVKSGPCLLYTSPSPRDY